MMRTGDDVGDQFGFNRIGPRWFQNSDNARGTPALEACPPDPYANRLAIRVQGVSPEPIGKYRGTRGVGTIVAGIQQASEHGAQPHHVEVIAVNDTGADRARFAQSEHGEIELRESTELGDGLKPTADVLDFRNE